jgi:hypothetical protein
MSPTLARGTVRGTVIAPLMGLAAVLPSTPHAVAVTSLPSSQASPSRCSRRWPAWNRPTTRPSSRAATLTPPPPSTWSAWCRTRSTPTPPAGRMIRGADPAALGVVTHSGAVIPGRPAAGLQLLPGLPAPYGHYTINPANNRCMPNGPDNGCNIYPDNGFTYDFPAACFTHAGIVITFVVTFGWTAYGNASRPGYNQPIPPGTTPTLEPAPTCRQPRPHAAGHRLATAAMSPRWSCPFEFFDSSWNPAATHLTYFAEDSCVVRHEPEWSSSWRLPIGTIRVDATLLEWESDQWLTRQVGTLYVLEPPRRHRQVMRIRRSATSSGPASRLPCID